MQWFFLGWIITGSMNYARYSHTASELTNGKVLVTPGYYYSTVLNSAEVYDPSTGIWVATGNIISGRTLHTASILTNGQVLISGGRDFISLNSADLY
jgi:hypothetical protein